MAVSLITAQQLAAEQAEWEEIAWLTAALIKPEQTPKRRRKSIATEKHS